MKQQRREYVDMGSTERLFVDVDSTKCIGCGICELVCSLEKGDKGMINQSLSRIRVLRLYPTINMAIACRVCEKAPCVRACPERALQQSIANGIIILNESRCTGCGWCVKACKYGSINMHPDKKVPMICDLCEGRKGIGVFPGRKIASQACVEWCPEEAVTLATRDRLAQNARKSAASSLFKEEKQKS